jgi:hypothetical protein
LDADFAPYLVRIARLFTPRRTAYQKASIGQRFDVNDPRAVEFEKKPLNPDAKLQLEG